MDRIQLAIERNSDWGKENYKREKFQAILANWQCFQPETNTPHSMVLCLSMIFPANESVIWK